MAICKCAIAPNLTLQLERRSLVTTSTVGLLPQLNQFSERLFPHLTNPIAMSNDKPRKRLRLLILVIWQTMALA
ncbi:hypothetical protein [uncultured Nostoc sp.]|uniref:hypothetical protein n=1 Tax=uncultured Nostoc sp. TaxID=340711 RepID=UPI0035CBAAC0